MCVALLAYRVVDSSHTLLPKVLGYWLIRMSRFKQCMMCAQDFREEQRAKRQRLLSASASACIRRGMIRYVQVDPDSCSLTWSCSKHRESCRQHCCISGFEVSTVIGRDQLL